MLAGWCGEHHLPDEGGMLDQDYQMLNRMKTLYQVYRTISAYRSAKGEQIHNMPPDIARTMKWLRESGYA